jgi:hypothetical protein
MPFKEKIKSLNLILPLAPSAVFTINLRKMRINMKNSSVKDGSMASAAFFIYSGDTSGLLCYIFDRPIPLGSSGSGCTASNNGQGGGDYGR